MKALDAAFRAKIESLGCLVDESPETRASASRDFGGLVEGDALGRVRPESPEALCRLVAFARSAGVQLTARALGLSQSGQSIPRAGVSVDLGALGGIQLDRDSRRVRCGPAVTWREVFAATAPANLAPKVMPFNLDLSIGGTLSAGGIGSSSHRWGFAASTVSSFETVLGTGELVTAGPDRSRTVYDAVLGGLGRFGVIASATLELREIRPITRVYYLLYEDLEPMLLDQALLTQRPEVVHLEGFASAALQGVRLQHGRRVPFARWFWGLHVAVERSQADPADDTLLSTLSAKERLHIEDCETTEFASRYDGRFAFMRGSGSWSLPHPWFEAMLPGPADVAAGVASEIIAGLPAFLGDGHRLMRVADVDRPAFLMHPKRCIGLAVLPMGVPRAFLAPTMDALRVAHRRVSDAGGKRYLSGWLFEPDVAWWRHHYGEQFDEVVRAKKDFDPDGVFDSTLQRSGVD